MIKLVILIIFQNNELFVGVIIRICYSSYWSRATLCDFQFNRFFDMGAKMKTIFLVVSFFIGLITLVNGSLAKADLVVQTPVGAKVGGELVHAKVSFDTMAGKIAIKIDNLLVDPNSVNSVVYGLMFKVGSGLNAGLISSMSGNAITIAKNTKFSAAPPVNGNTWKYSPVGTSIYLDGLLNGADYGVIGGPNGSTYSNAKGSIAGNAPHNPFYYLSLSFLLSVTGVTDSTAISDVAFKFNTSKNSTTGVPQDIVGVPLGQVDPVPELSSVLVWSGVAGIVGLGSVIRRRRQLA